MAGRAADHRLAVTLALGVLTIWLLGMAIIVRSAALGPEASGKMLAVFEPGTNQDAIFSTLVAAGGRPIRDTWLPFVWVVAGDEAGFAGRLKQHGAVGAYGELPFALSVAGCLAYADAKVAELFSLRP
jgi:hypothetical protein